MTFAERRVPNDDAAQFVRLAVSSAYTRGVTGMEGAAAVLSLPIDRMREWFGPWGGEAEAIDERTTRWPIAPDLPETMLASLVWIPEGVEYRLEGPPVFLDAAHDAAMRMARASSRRGVHEAASDDGR